MREKYAIGVDFGTESGRAVLVSLENGKEITEHVTDYRDGVIDDTLPGSTIKLGYEWALQNPQNYVEVLTNSIPAVLKKGEVNPTDIVGLGIDFTACTMLLIDEKGVRLIFIHDLRNNPHSCLKLWKHHAAQVKANRLYKVINHIT